MILKVNIPIKINVIRTVTSAYVLMPREQSVLVDRNKYIIEHVLRDSPLCLPDANK